MCSSWIKLAPLVVLAVSCQKSSSSATDTSPSPTTDQTTTAGTVAISLPETPDGAFSVAGNSLTSALQVDGAKGALEGGGANYTPGTVAIETGLRLDTATSCNSTGFPVHTDAAKNTNAGGTTMMRNDIPEYPGALFFCKLNHNSYTFETIQGAYDLTRSMVCGAKSALKFNEAPLTVSMKSDDPCILDPEMRTLIDDTSGQGFGGKWEFQLVMKKPSSRAAEGWDYDLYAGDFRNGSSDADLANAMVKVSFKSSNDTVGFLFHMNEPDGSGFGGDTYALSVKLGEKALLSYESRRQFVECTSASSCQSGQRKYTRHTRLVAEGKTDDKGKFLALDKFEGATSTFDWGQSLSSDPSTVNLFTIRGSAKKGFKTLGYSAISPVPAGAPLSSLTLGAADGSTCFGGNQKCTDITPLTPTADSDMAFLLDPRSSTAVKAKAWFAGAKPLKFSSVTFADSQE